MFQTYVILCLSAAAGGAVNAVAGGGTLLTFPALVLALGGTDEATVIANATSSLALVPGSIASAWGYRRELATMRRWAVLLAPPSLLGGCVGALLVVGQPPKVFATLVPWLILLAASLFGLQPQLARWTGVGQHHAKPTSRSLAIIVVFQFVVSVYGGYFGAGAGILMLSALAMMGFENIHEMNSLKSTLGTLINVVAVFVFIVGHRIDWPFAIAMAVSAAIGGYFGASIARTLDKRLVRNAIVVIGFSLAAIYFYRQWAATPQTSRQIDRSGMAPHHFVKEDPCRHADIERIDARRHRNFHAAVALADKSAVEAVTFAAEQKCQPIRPG